jgi:hypothetical protein
VPHWAFLGMGVAEKVAESESNSSALSRLGHLLLLRGQQVNRRGAMSNLNAFLTGGVVGAGAMYFFDPEQGKRRQALLEDQCHRLSRETAEGLDVAWRDLGNRARGTLAEPGIHAFTKWTPGTRLLAGSVGGMLMANCLMRRDIGSLLMGTLGFSLAMCAMAGPGSCASAVGGKRRRAAGSTGSLRGSGAPTHDVGYFHPPGAREVPVWGSSTTPTPQPAETSGHFPPAV